ncbi:hypothetical protein ACFFR3_08045 [Nonomuraea salmonea]|uniref:Uncharacterized protein n=1 Tax=Nonomuraea salmonea TaxID=46181 RepID=A0ABV5NGM5_9ACTN
MAHPPPQPPTTLTIATTLAASTAAAWAALHLTPGIHLDGPPAHQAQAIAITALLLLATALGSRITIDHTAARRNTPAHLHPGILAISLLLTPAALWLSSQLCTALGLPLRIDGPAALLTGWLVIAAVRLLTGAALKLLTQRTPT